MLKSDIFHVLALLLALVILMFYLGQPGLYLENYIDAAVGPARVPGRLSRVVSWIQNI